MPTPGPLELVIILVIALIVLGPGRLPDVGAALGKSIREFRKASSDLQEATKIDTSPLPPEPAKQSQQPPATPAPPSAPAAPSAAPPAAESPAAEPPTTGAADTTDAPEQGGSSTPTA